MSLVAGGPIPGSSVGPMTKKYVQPNLDPRTQQTLMAQFQNQAINTAAEQQPLSETDKRYLGVQQNVLGPAVNTATMSQPTINQDLNPTAITHGETTAVTPAQLRGAADLAAQYGNITYDRGAIEDIFQKATESEYAAKEKAYARTAGQYYNRLGQSSLSYLDSMRKANAGAVQSGANTGMQNANALSALLGMSQQSSADSTKLAQDARALADQKAAAQTLNTANALTQANQTGLALGTMGANIYGVDAQREAAQLGHNAQVSAANVAADASAYSSDRYLQGSQYNADANLAGQKYNADTNFLTQNRATDSNLYGNMYASDNNRAGTQYSADKNLEGTKIAAGATRAAAGASASAAKYAANQNYNAQIHADNTMLTNTLLQQKEPAALQGVLDTLFP